MADWVLQEANLKRYPHFDPFISTRDAMALATDPERVVKHAFFPFIRYQQHWTKFAKKGAKGKPKDRPIRYAARSDAYIYAYYRHVLSELYESKLSRLTLTENVLAYRRIPDELTSGGKCNIHFARDAVRKIRQIGDCYVLTLDISSFFESIDHEKLKAAWSRLLNVERLPSDHFKVYEAITRYSFVDKTEAYKRLGHYGPKRTSKTGKPINGYLTGYKDLPKKLTDGKAFRTVIAGAGSQKSLIEKNYKPYGIPQGAPISDLLANLYLIDFDRDVVSACAKASGFYCRYSDDILIVAPGGESEGVAMIEYVRNLIKLAGKKLEIKDDKTSLLTFERNNGDQKFTVTRGKAHATGLEYLGFRYDGKHVYIRDSTLSNLYRKVSRAARRDADNLVRTHPKRDLEDLKNIFNYERLTKKFGRVESFGEKQIDYRNWTFWTYARRASEIFGPIGRPVMQQLKRHRQNIRDRVEKELAAAIARHD